MSDEGSHWVAVSAAAAAAAEEEEEEEAAAEEEGKKNGDAEKSAPVTLVEPRGKKPGYVAEEESVGTPAAAAAADNMYDDLRQTRGKKVTEKS